MAITSFTDPFLRDRTLGEFELLKKKCEELQKIIASDKRKFLEQYVLNRALCAVNLTGELAALAADDAWNVIQKCLKEEPK